MKVYDNNNNNTPFIKPPTGTTEKKVKKTVHPPIYSAAVINGTSTSPQGSLARIDYRNPSKYVHQNHEWTFLHYTLKPTEILGAMVGGALVGTFLGIFLAYTIVGPIAARLGQVIEEEGKLMNIVKIVLVAHLHGNAPQISVEIGRRNIPTAMQPTFAELEEAIAEIPPDL